MAMFSQTASLDPVRSSGSGVAGGTELSALYDTVMRYNPATQTFEARTAESLSANDDATVWTLTLREGITFRDGTPYDTEAVRLSFERFGGPENTANQFRSHLALVDEVEVVDDRTVRFTLVQSWSGFPALLADQPGMLVSPAALAALGDPDYPGYDDRRAEFELRPVGAGAGPFEIVSFRPGEGIVMERNPDYWGGDVYLDGLEFIVLGGAAAALEALRADSVQVALLRNAAVVADAKEDGFPGHSVATQGGQILLMNNGRTVICQDGQPAPACTGQEDGTPVVPETATSRPEVRQAVAAAIDAAEVDRRANDGKGLPGNALFQESFPYYAGVPGPEVDPERATELLEAARADGYDGRIRLLCSDSPERQTLAIAVQTMLEAVGFDVVPTTGVQIGALIGQVISQPDFDLACWGMSIPPDDGAVLALRFNWIGGAPTNWAAYSSEEMDAALSDVLGAMTDEEKAEAYGRIAEIYARDVPSLVLEALPDFIAWQPRVRGVLGNQNLMLHFDQAWIER